MFKNYLKIALRNLFKNKVYSFINIFGLSVGITCCFLILLYVGNETSYDSFHKNAKYLYRAALFENYGPDQQGLNTVTPVLLGPTFRDYIPEIKNYVRVMANTGLMKEGDISSPERFHLADPSFFEIFSFPLIKGDARQVLKESNSMVLTVSSAHKYFGNEDPIGKIISLKIKEKFEDFIVTGIAGDVPSNSSIQFGFVIPFEKTNEIYSARSLASWFNVFTETYILLQPGFTVEQLNTKIPSVVKAIMGNNYKAGVYNPRFQPITDIHLNPDYPAALEPVSNPVYIYILSIIALLILTIASINFITLSIGKSASRASEIGIRKVIGADRKQLITQFWGEAVLVVLIAALFSVVLTEFTLPLFNNLSGKSLSIDYNPATFLSFFAIILLIGLSAGIYPALILSGFHPSEVLKGKFRITSKKRLRSSLVVGQFVLSIVLLTSTLIISEQLKYMREKNLGFNKDCVIEINTNVDPRETERIADLYGNELKKEKEVENVSFAFQTLSQSWIFIGFNLSGSFNQISVNKVGYDYIKTLGMEIKSGRDFSRDISSDFKEAVIVNEAFIRKYNINFPSENSMPGKFAESKIIGVVKDFNFESLHTEIKPAVLSLNLENIYKYAEDVVLDLTPTIFVRVHPGNIVSAMSKLKTTWERIVPEIPFKSQFLDEEIQRQYQSEEKISSVVTVSSLLAIIITCLGLFGLSILFTIQKTKEIGIRKVLGAPLSSILVLLTREFISLVLIALVIGIPLSYYLMNKWLSEFVYRINISAFSFIISGVLVLLVALATISIRVVRVALLNPVVTIKYE